MEKSVPGALQSPQRQSDLFVQQLTTIGRYGLPILLIPPKGRVSQEGGTYPRPCPESGLQSSGTMQEALSSLQKARLVIAVG